MADHLRDRNTCPTRRDALGFAIAGMVTWSLPAVRSLAASHLPGEEQEPHKDERLYLTALKEPHLLEGRKLNWSSWRAPPAGATPALSYPVSSEPVSGAPAMVEPWPGAAMAPMVPSGSGMPGGTSVASSISVPPASRLVPLPSRPMGANSPSRSGSVMRVGESSGYTNPGE